MNVPTDITSLFCYGLAIAFIGAGIANIFGLGSTKDDWERWKFPRGFNVLTGCLEIGASIMIVVPTTRLAGLAALLLIMLGALATLIKNKEGVAHLAPAVGLLVAVVIGLIAST